MSELVSNLTDRKHGSRLRLLLRESSDVFLAVAFLKESGLKPLLPEIHSLLDRGGAIRLVAGSDFYLTEPAALHEIFKLQELHPQCRLHLVGEDGRSTFHPKYYRFTGGEKTQVVVGSANLTAGGLERNIELSLLATGQPDEKICRTAASVESAIIANPRCKPATLEVIGRYEVRYAIHHLARKTAEREARKRLAKIVTLENAELDKYRREYLADAGQQAEFQLRTANYLNARKRLELLSIAKLSKSEFIAQFEPMVGEPGGRLWHSDGLYRQKKVLFAQHSKIQSMINEIRANLEDAPDVMYDRGVRWMARIERLGPNLFTEICSTFAPSRYPVLNWNPVTSLYELGVAHLPAPSDFRPSDYLRFTDFLHRIRQHCGFADLGRTDHFLNYVYWIKKEQNS